MTNPEARWQDFCVVGTIPGFGASSADDLYKSKTEGAFSLPASNMASYFSYPYLFFFFIVFSPMLAGEKIGFFSSPHSAFSATIPTRNVC